MRASNPFEDTCHSDEAAGPYPYSYQHHQYGAHKYSPYQKGYQGQAPPPPPPRLLCCVLYGTTCLFVCCCLCSDVMEGF
jgi:hypothetical protein